MPSFADNTYRAIRCQLAASYINPGIEARIVLSIEVQVCVINFNGHVLVTKGRLRNGLRGSGLHSVAVNRAAHADT